MHTPESNLVKKWVGMVAFGATLMMLTSGIIAIRPEVFYPDSRKHMIIQGAVLNAILTFLAFIFSCGFLSVIDDRRSTCEDWQYAHRYAHRDDPRAGMQCCTYRCRCWYRCILFSLENYLNWHRGAMQFLSTWELLVLLSKVQAARWRRDGCSNDRELLAKL